MSEGTAAARRRRSESMLQRLEQVGALLFDEATRSSLRSRGAGLYLHEVARTVRAREDDELTWVALVAFTAAYPTSELFDWFRRALALAPEEAALRIFLEAGSRTATGFADLGATVEVVTGAVVVDVDFPARHGHNTGVQRVVRQTVSRWAQDHDIIPVAWVHGSLSFRRLSEIEHERVVDWAAADRGEWRHGDPDQVAFVVPYRSVVVLPSVPDYNQCGPLAALAEYSGNEVVIVGHDAIPVVSADTVPPEETVRFVNFLSVVKRAARVATVSSAAALEYGGFVRALPAQGLVGPSIEAVPLPVELPDGLEAPAGAASAVPMVLCVGSQEPRKNHLAVLHAAEILWREGLRFRLRFLGGANPWAHQVFDPRVRELVVAGRPIEVLRGVGDDVLVASYREARFLAFPSLHEGYGLPVAEALAVGLPVLTSRFGSTAQIAEHGGCVLVDPASDEEIIDGMRRMLTSAELIDSLRAEALARPQRTWDDYARELWEALIRPSAVVVDGTAPAALTEQEEARHAQ
ncbi:MULTISPECIES: glycosyltransferase family 4 protein [unclassified Rathayibacter]|uniref:glycosyltransferase family 4 protein n=1 Tax=unclassified Rathayibacter TaxID=2609250 RepID=UPI00188BB234|nr:MULTISPECIES: glycosyltransferase family 1 protein [unclassified Rathayibacter]MBF4463347.1 glycosyltransferase family 4 protein [Rathayibacter sp. VKM Ac-2879]MBF4504930.1 glycosyltransferase family 4 protein [Rathayibacter sp. VKM Ac-2878]